MPPALSQQHKKAACALAWNVQALAEKYGIERLGFLTLTTPDQARSSKVVQRRFNSLATHVLRARYVDYIRVSERHKSGSVHLHLLVVMPEGVDIRTGINFEEIAAGNYASAPKALRSEWKAWRVTAPRYGFGRHELLPVKSTAEGIARYVGKYISKAVARRTADDHGVRLVEYSRGARIANTKFGWASNGATAWRNKVALFARIVGIYHGVVDVAFRDLSILLGDDWAHRHRSFIASLPEINNGILEGFAAEFAAHADAIVRARAAHTKARALRHRPLDETTSSPSEQAYRRHEEQWAHTGFSR